MGLDRIHPHDDFFGVGGDSLDAVEMAEMLTAELGRNVGMETVIQSQTFAEMLATVDN
ncbi:acyl carrier protein [Nonomuraea turcica]|uniref:acyl carrier protein n=1 Tax=Nonomuraea sp. G32 TaxID=3067274 RepID=UPI00273B4765|nr:acyl carrier protein [Nonomuraea sp. G32]MDP4500501.1 acyl carrier protein [Nonomuraea sp. G32]